MSPIYAHVYTLEIRSGTSGRWLRLAVDPDEETIRGLAKAYHDRCERRSICPPRMRLIGPDGMEVKP